jgi:hypothetical protein
MTGITATTIIKGLLKNYIMNTIETFSDFISAIKSVAYCKIKEILDSGNIKYIQLFEYLGCPTLKEKYGRLNLPYKLLKEHIIPLEQKGLLCMVDSDFGKAEKSEKSGIASKPTSADMFPDSAGWNIYGGPTYEITLNGNQLQVIAKFCHQEIEGYSDMSISMVWQERTFTFRIPQGNTEVMEELLKNIYAEKIVHAWIDKETDASIDEKVVYYADMITQKLNQ